MNLRLEVPIQDLPLGALPSDLFETPAGADDVLTIQEEAGHRFIAVDPDTPAGPIEAFAIFKDGDPVADMAVEWVVDPWHPWLDETQYTGAVLRSLISDETRETVIAHRSYNGTIMQGLGSSPEDVSIGYANGTSPQVHFCAMVEHSPGSKHYRVRGGGTRDNRSQDSSYSMKYGAGPIAVRVQVVGSVVNCWMNPHGELRFETPPILSFSTDVSPTGAARMGLFKVGRSGRITRLVFEYGRAPMNQPPTIRTVDAATTLRHSPMRVTFTPDESRPPILAEHQIAEWGDTKLPERMARTSMVHLRDMRVRARPGHEYRASGSFLDVDGNRVPAGERRFTVDGSADEDLLLRDVDGKLILAPDDELPDGEERSPIRLLIWPEEIEPSYVLDSDVPVPGRLQRFFDGIHRGVDQGVSQVRTIDIPFQNLDQSKKARLLEFIRAARGQTAPLLWTHPTTGERVVVRFADPVFNSTGGENMRWSGSVTLIEDRFFDGDAAQILEFAEWSDPAGPECSCDLPCEIEEDPLDSSDFPEPPDPCTPGINWCQCGNCLFETGSTVSFTSEDRVDEYGSTGCTGTLLGTSSGERLTISASYAGCGLYVGTLDREEVDFNEYADFDWHVESQVGVTVEYDCLANTWIYTPDGGELAGVPLPLPGQEFIESEGDLCSGYTSSEVICMGSTDQLQRNVSAELVVTNASGGQCPSVDACCDDPNNRWCVRFVESCISSAISPECVRTRCVRIGYVDAAGGLGTSFTCDGPTDPADLIATLISQGNALNCQGCLEGSATDTVYTLQCLGPSGFSCPDEQLFPEGNYSCCCN